MSKYCSGRLQISHILPASNHVLRGWTHWSWVVGGLGVMWAVWHIYCYSDWQVLTLPYLAYLRWNTAFVLLKGVQGPWLMKSTLPVYAILIQIFSLTSLSQGIFEGFTIWTWCYKNRNRWLLPFKIQVDLLCMYAMNIAVLISWLIIWILISNQEWLQLRAWNSSWRVLRAGGSCCEAPFAFET